MNFIALFDKFFNDVVSRSCIIDDVFDNVSTVNVLLGCRTRETKKEKPLKETKSLHSHKDGSLKLFASTHMIFKENMSNL
jgi:hypothetical protein